MRFLNTLGYYQSAHSNDISYNMYRGGKNSNYDLMPTLGLEPRVSGVESYNSAN